MKEVFPLSRLLSDLRNIIPDPERVTTNETVREQHSRDITSYHAAVLPDVVVFPQNTAEVAAIVRYANENGVPITPFGVGSSLEGHVTPMHGGISLNLMQMNQVLEVLADDFLVKVQPGVTRMQLNKHLKQYGLFFPVDPGADASLGGMAATNASGTAAVRYGTMRDNVLGLEVVMADGQAIRTGGMATKSSAGYNLTGLIVGSEGTLGVITELTLRLYGIPEFILSARATFPDVGAASNAAMGMISCGLNIDRVELVDEQTVEAVNAFKNTDFPVAPSLFLEFSGNELSVRNDFELAKSILEDEGCLLLEHDTDNAKRAILWAARHDAALAIAATAPGKKLMTTDVCVPLSKMPEAIVNARQTIDEHGLYAAILGHVGDGNYHAAFVVDADDPADVARAKKVNDRIVQFSLENGGTCTGEHGVGIGKAGYLMQEHGAAVAYMQAIKQALDPKNTLNPGKIFVGKNAASHV
ncbi:MAG: FAD-binding oxidoreductase [Tumebacillaceae bacterium]